MHKFTQKLHILALQAGKRKGHLGLKLCLASPFQNLNWDSASNGLVLGPLGFYRHKVSSDICDWKGGFAVFYIVIEHWLYVSFVGFPCWNLSIC